MIIGHSETLNGLKIGPLLDAVRPTIYRKPPGAQRAGELKTVVLD